PCLTNPDPNSNPYMDSCLQAAAAQDTSLKLLPLAYGDTAAMNQKLDPTCGDDQQCRSELRDCIEEFRLGNSQQYVDKNKADECVAIKMADLCKRVPSKCEPQAGDQMRQAEAQARASCTVTTNSSG